MTAEQKTRRAKSAALREVSAALIALLAGGRSQKLYSLIAYQERYRYRSECSKLELEQKSTEESVLRLSANIEFCLWNSEAAGKFATSAASGIQSHPCELRLFGVSPDHSRFS
jgi:hypothetical protein